MLSMMAKKFQEQQQQAVVVELGLKLNQQQQQDHHHHRRADHDNHDDGDGDIRCGATTCNGYNKMMMSSSPICSFATPVAGDSTTSVHSSSTTTTRTTNPSSVSVSGGFVRGLQPFDVSSSSYYYSSPNLFVTSSGGISTTGMGYPFTAAQWKELERQAMIYKYMMASLPVPLNLLYSSFPSNSTFAPSSYLVGKYGGGIAMRWSGNSKDAEPGRCRRTDGKKWRCSRDVAPNQKYCERHMHRGRPRSRKHVEQQQQQNHQKPISNLSFTNSSNNNDNITPTKKTCFSSDITNSVQQPCSKAPFFSHPLPSSTTPFDDSRNLGWTEEQQWNQLVQTNNTNSSLYQQQFEGEPLNLISHGGYNTKCDNMGMLERPLIDAWSMGVTSGNKDNGGNGNKLSISSSNGGNNANTIDEEMCQIHMGLGLIDSWVGNNTTPGGPLAEVLRPGNPAMPDAGESEFVTPPATAVSSPSGVLQKTFATFSDSSGNNSPTTTCHNSKPHSDMPFRWLN